MAKQKKTKKHDTFIDMTAMSDMTVLLLTFFMLTATFLPMEPVQVITPMSVSETKIPEYNSITILVDPQGKVFMNIDVPEQAVEILEKVGADYGITFSNAQKHVFKNDVTHVGVPIRMMPAFLDIKDVARRGEEVKKLGIPIDSANNQLATWVRHSRAVMGKDMIISVKADQSTQFPKVDKVMKILVEIKENRYSLVTTLKTMPSGL